MSKKKEKKIDPKDKDNKTQISGTSAANYSGSDHKEKNLYLIQIQYLNEKVDRCQLKCDKLEEEKRELTTRLSVLENEKKDIAEYLKRALLEKEEEADELRERLEGQRQAADEDRDARQLLHNQLTQQLQNRVNELVRENGTLAGSLADLEGFQRQKEQLMSEMKTMEKKLVRQEEEHQAAVHSLEIRVLMDKERLEKEAEKRAASMQAEVDHLVNQRVPEAVRSAMKETLEVKAQFSQLSELALVLTEENSALRDRRSQLRVDVGNLEQMLKEVSRQSCVQKKTIEKLKGNYERAQRELSECRHQLQHLQSKHRDVLADIEAHRKSFSQTSAGSRNTTDPAATFPTSRTVADP